jgi:hypothetical protein
MATSSTPAVAAELSYNGSSVMEDAINMLMGDRDIDTHIDTRRGQHAAKSIDICDTDRGYIDRHGRAWASWPPMSEIDLYDHFMCTKEICIARTWSFTAYPELFTLTVKDNPTNVYCKLDIPVIDLLLSNHGWPIVAKQAHITIAYACIFPDGDAGWSSFWRVKAGAAMILSRRTVTMRFKRSSGTSLILNNNSELFALIMMIRDMMKTTGVTWDVTDDNFPFHISWNSI